MKRHIASTSMDKGDQHVRRCRTKLSLSKPVAFKGPDAVPTCGTGTECSSYVGPGALFKGPDALPPSGPQSTLRNGVDIYDKDVEADDGAAGAEQYQLEHLPCAKFIADTFSPSTSPLGITCAMDKANEDCGLHDVGCDERASAESTLQQPTAVKDSSQQRCRQSGAGFGCAETTRSGHDGQEELLEAHAQQHVPLTLTPPPSNNMAADVSVGADNLVNVPSVTDLCNNVPFEAEEIAETDEDEGRASPPPLGSQHDEGEGDDATLKRAVKHLEKSARAGLEIRDEVYDDEQECERTGSEVRAQVLQDAKLTAALEPSIECVCMLCGMDLSGQDLAARERHLNLCLDQSEGGHVLAEASARQRVGAAAENAASPFHCSICGENLTWWSVEHRTVHTNQCCDAMLQAQAAAKCSAAAAHRPTQNAPHSLEDDDVALPRAALASTVAHRRGTEAASRTASRTPSDVLRSMGLEKYAAVLESVCARDVGALGRLTEGQMRELGLSVGARKRLLSVQVRACPTL